MPINIGAIAGISSALTSQKISMAQDGSKTFTKPKTLAGKLLGNITGRTAGYETQLNMNKEAVSNSAIQSGFPVSGGLNFGGQATKNTWLPFAIVAAVAVYFFSKNKKRRRR